jgi:hypothetical protein
MPPLEGRSILLLRAQPSRGTMHTTNKDRQVQVESLGCRLTVHPRPPSSVLLSVGAPVRMSATRSHPVEIWFLSDGTLVAQEPQHEQTDPTWLLGSLSSFCLGFVPARDVVVAPHVALPVLPQNHPTTYSLRTDGVGSTYPAGSPCRLPLPLSWWPWGGRVDDFELGEVHSAWAI